MFFFAIITNLNSEILLLLKDGMGSRKENFNRGSLKNTIFRRVHEKPIYKERMAYRGWWWGGGGGG